MIRQNESNCATDSLLQMIHLSCVSVQGFNQEELEGPQSQASGQKGMDNDSDSDDDVDRSGKE